MGMVVNYSNGRRSCTTLTIQFIKYVDKKCSLLGKYVANMVTALLIPYNRLYAFKI